MRIILFKLISTLTFIFGCEKIHYYPDKQIHFERTRFLCHAGGGNSIYQENSLPAIKYGLTKLDGIEVDIQLSKNRTIWLFNNNKLPDCANITGTCFADTYDTEIIQTDSCMGANFSITRLEEVFNFMSVNYPDKQISLDCKAWVPCGIADADITGILNALADEINKLTTKYKLQGHVMVESEVATFLAYIKRNFNGIETYLATLGDFERGMQLALEAGFSGISFKYNFKEIITENHISLIHKKGLKIHLWTINTEATIRQALSINPDYIQTDDINLEFFQNYYKSK